MKNKNQSKNIVHAKDKINLLLSCGGNYSTRQICNIINTK